MKLWTNGHFHSMRDQHHEYFNILTENGKIIAVNVDEAKYPSIERIDLREHHAYPGMVDAHMHLLGYGQKLTRLDLTGLSTKQEILVRLRTATACGLFVADGYRDCQITKHDLDTIFSNQPAVLMHNDYHSVTANSRALEIADVLSDTGILIEQASKKLVSKLLTYDKETLKEYFRKALDELYAVGITGGHSDDLFYFGGHEKTFSAIKEVLDEQPFRTHLLVHNRIFEDFYNMNHSETKYLELGAVKLFYDGTLSSKTALVSQPYKDTQSYGQRMQPIDDFKQLIKKIRSYGLTAAVHVIGDNGLDELTDILTELPPKPNQRDRIIHASLSREETLRKLRKMPVVLDIQPLFVSSDMPYMDTWFSKTPPLVYAWKTYLEHGLSLLGSSDSPVEDPNPLLGIHSLINRQSHKDGKVYISGERLDRFTAISLYTTSHVLISKHENEKGYLDVGYLADLTVFPDDLMQVPESKLLTMKPSMTVIDEKIVYRPKVQ